MGDKPEALPWLQDERLLDASKWKFGHQQPDGAEEAAWNNYGHLWSEMARGERWVSYKA